MIRNKSASLGLLSSLAGSLCCMVPLVTAFGGIAGVASMISWIESPQPYLIGASLLLLGLAWYQKLCPQTNDECGCEVPKKRNVLQSMGFLAFVTILSVLLLTFPLYAHLVYPQKPTISVTTPQLASSQNVEFAVKGMGCASCEPEVENAVAKGPGILRVKASALQKNTVVLFDPAKTNIAAIRVAINSTGYTVQYVKP